MTRQEFLHRLWELLADVTPEERNEALRFYNEYFDEAGPEQELELLKELGSPEKVASIIKTNVPGSSAQPRYYSPVIAKPEPAYTGPVPEPAVSGSNAKNNNWVWVLVVAIIVLAPILIGIAGGLIGLLFGILGATVGCVVGGVVCAFGGIVIVIKGIISMGLGVGTALMTMGVGFLTSAMGIGMLALSCWFAFWLLPGLWKGAKWCWNKVHGLIRGNAQ